LGAAIGFSGKVSLYLSITLALLGRLVYWRVAVLWYVLAVCYPIAILSGVEIAHRLIAGAWISLRPPQWFAVFLGTILTLPVNASEEIGWRGYALPRLTKRFGLRRASLILGPIWACWYLPVFSTPGTGAYAHTIPTFFLELTALSVAFAWLYGNTSGSLLPVTLMHSAIDSAFALLPALRTSAGALTFTTELVPWLIIGFAWLLAAYFLARMPLAPGSGNGIDWSWSALASLDGEALLSWAAMRSTSSQFRSARWF